MASEDILGRLISIADNAAVQKAFGEPRTIGSKTIIPVARVTYGLGGGFGEGIEDAGGEGAHKPGSGKGAGGGGGASIVPRAVISIAGDQIEVMPVVDVNRIVMAGVLLAAWNVFWITHTVRSFAKRRRHQSESSEMGKH